MDWISLIPMVCYAIGLLFFLLIARKKNRTIDDLQTRLLVCRETIGAFQRDYLAAMDALRDTEKERDRLEKFLNESERHQLDNLFS